MNKTIFDVLGKDMEAILQLYDELYFLIIYAIRIPEVLGIMNKHNGDIKN